MKNIVMLISGSGSNLQATINTYGRRQINGALQAVFSNKAGVLNPERACAAGIPAHTLAQSQFADWEAFDHRLMHETDAHVPDLVVPAGYIRILSLAFISYCQEHLLNIHPSLLLKYPGLHTYRQVLENGDEKHGISMHFVADGLDDSPVTLQAKVPVFAGDSEDEVAVQVQAQEHAIYPLIIDWSIDRRLHMTGNHAQPDGRQLPPQGYTAEE